jgi:transposase
MTREPNSTGTYLVRISRGVGAALPRYFRWTARKFPASRFLAEQGAKAVIPSTTSRSQPIPYSKRLYRQRNLIERMFAPSQGLPPYRYPLRQARKKFPRWRLHCRSRNLVAQLSPDSSITVAVSEEF